MKAWKWIGLAGVAGVAAAGAVKVHNDRRQWKDTDADDLRDKLHSRLDDANGKPGANGDGDLSGA